ncbi:putative Late nodulin [Medicago truncatula]|uniref:Nodule Cysteine-Rich (NCR) secreted peptide n=1 Tax=Medicago truncatula TaxID=3880 RepID=A0A072U1S4_MEDTR|nr:Nodule Cysteine-Rich (NCR) secreted peptide [Medicago truncatula]RHN46374.1 putative Late nodulin [Medicago truncatula]
MAEIFKFVYKWILFVSLFLVIVAKEDDIECVTDADCYEKLPALQRAVMKCIQGFCKIHI